MPFELFDLFSNSAAEEARNAANLGLQRGYKDLSAQYGLGRDALTTNYGKATDAYGRLIDEYAPGAAAYSDVSGAGGAEGLQRATDLFKSSPSYGVYGFTRDAALQAADRARARGGDLRSGAANFGDAKIASDLASGTWGQFQAGLLPYLNNYGSAIGGQAGTYTGLGQGLNASFTGQGNAANATQTQIGANNAASELNRYKVGANDLNAIIGGVQLAMGKPPTQWGQIGAPGSGGGGGGGGGVGAGTGYGGGGSYGAPNAAGSWGGDWSNNPIAQGWNAGKNLFSSFGATP